MKTFIFGLQTILKLELYSFLLHFADFFKTILEQYPDLIKMI